MELLQNLTNKIILLRNTPKYSIFKRRRLQKDIKEIEKQINDSDIYRVSGAALSYLVSTTPNDNYLIQLDNGFLVKWTDTTMQITIDNTITIVFYPKLNKFLIYEDLKTYNIYRNTPIPKMLQTDWEILCEKMKRIYIETVYHITDIKFIT